MHSASNLIKGAAKKEDEVAAFNPDYSWLEGMKGAAATQNQEVDYSQYDIPAA